MASAHCLLQGSGVTGSVFLTWKLGPFLQIKATFKGLTPEFQYKLIVKEENKEHVLHRGFRGDRNVFTMTLHGLDLKPWIGRTMRLEAGQTVIALGIIGISGQHPMILTIA
jgi:hypothetical protein